MSKHSQCLDSLQHLVDCCLPTSWSGTGALVFPLLLPIAGFIAVWYDTQAIQAIPFLEVLGVTVGVACGCCCWSSRLTTSLAIYHRPFSQSIQDLQWVAQVILTVQGQIDSLATVVPQNQRGFDLLIAERGGLGTPDRASKT